MTDEGVNLVTVRIDMNLCDMCLECVHTCPTPALIYEDTRCIQHNPDECQYCEVCMDVCPMNCIEILER